MKNYKFYENKFISKKDRCKISDIDKKELKKDFYNSNILILGAAGSIGNTFTKRLIEFEFKNLYLIDKNENDLTGLNREIVLTTKYEKIIKIRYICSDLTLMNIDNFIKKNKITHYLNFAALKHVRSEEELISLKYMFLTNSKNFLPLKKHSLKKVFSVSTDKTVNSTSLLGMSKMLMEKKLSKFKKDNSKVFVSSTRFANVSFSNGSILKYVVDRISEKKIFGIPRTIRRYFITHEEASSLCFKSLLKRNNNMILIPNKKFLSKEYLIKDIVVKILKIDKYKPYFLNTINAHKNKNIKINKSYPVHLTEPNTDGQKLYEEFYENSEKVYPDKKDKTISKVMLPISGDVNKIVNNVLKFGDINKIKSYLTKNFKSYKSPKDIIQISKYL